MELAINNLIKMIIAAVVIVVVILGVYLAMRFYIIPYFKGISVGVVGVLLDKSIIHKI